MPQEGNWAEMPSRSFEEANYKHEAPEMIVFYLAFPYATRTKSGTVENLFRKNR